MRQAEKEIFWTWWPSVGPSVYHSRSVWAQAAPIYVQGPVLPECKSGPQRGACWGSDAERALTRYWSHRLPASPPLCSGDYYCHAGVLQRLLTCVFLLLRHLLERFQPPESGFQGPHLCTSSFPTPDSFNSVPFEQPVRPPALCFIAAFLTQESLCPSSSPSKSICLYLKCLPYPPEHQPIPEGTSPGSTVLQLVYKTELFFPVHLD